MKKSIQSIVMLRMAGLFAILIALIFTACPPEPNPTTYAVTVTNGTGSSNYAQGATVTITANAPPAGQQFKDWTVNSGGVTLADANNAITTFTMPGNAVTVTANFAASGGDPILTFTDLDAFSAWLAEQSNNTPETAYSVKLNVSNTCEEIGNVLYSLQLKHQ